MVFLVRQAAGFSEDKPNTGMTAEMQSKPII